MARVVTLDSFASRAARVCASAVIVFLLVTSAGCRDPRPGGEFPSAPPATELAELAWLAGSWVSEEDGTFMEEHWIAPSGGLMLGVHRDVSSEGSSFFEFLRIEATGDGVVYLAMPGARPATPFGRIESGPNRVVFSNPTHDFPQRILYWLERGELHARIEGETPEGERSREWVYRRSAAR